MLFQTFFYFSITADIPHDISFSVQHSVDHLIFISNIYLNITLLSSYLVVDYSCFVSYFDIFLLLILKSAFPLKSCILWSLPSVLLVSSTICWSLGIFSYLWIKHGHVWQKTGQLWCRWAKTEASEQERLEEDTRVELRRKTLINSSSPSLGPRFWSSNCLRAKVVFAFLEIIWPM